MPNRIIRESICTSESLAQISAAAERLWWRIIAQADDFGRMDARTQVIIGQCLTSFLGTVRPKEVESWLQELVNSELLHFYHAAGKRYLQIVKWDKYQTRRAKHSKYPDPISLDSICMQVQADENNCVFGVTAHAPVRGIEERGIEEYIVPFAEVVDCLNRQTGKNYRVCDSTKRLIQARWNNGYRLEHFKKVIDLKAQEWRGTNMDKYLRPETLFKEKKFEAYLNQAPKPKVNTVPDAEEIIRRNEEDGFID